MSDASMVAPSAEVVWPARSVRWSIWLIYVVSWSAALLVPVPVKPRENSALLHPLVLFLFSKSLHVAAYALLAVLSGWLRLRGRACWLMMAFLLFHAAATEFLQWLLPTGRTGCVRDVVLDAVGIGLGMAITWKWWRQEA